MKTQIKTVMLIALMLLLGSAARAQDVAIKTNLLHDAGLTPNLGLEFGIAPKWTFDISVDVNQWPVKHGYKYDHVHQKRYWKQWFVQPEFRYWFCEKFQGNFIGLHLIGGQYNVGNIGFLPNFLNNRFKDLRDERWKGWGVGAGISYGHTWVLGTHWNLEAEIGVGWMYTRYDRFGLTEDGSKGKKIQDGKVHNYVGPTKLALNLEYVF